MPSKKKTPLDKTIALMKRSHDAVFAMDHWFGVRLSEEETSFVSPNYPIINGEQPVPKTFECGTTACVAGFVLAANLPEGTRTVREFHGAAADLLGINHEESMRLFRTNWGATRLDAIATLEHLRDTGEVQWKNAKGTERL